MHNTLRAAAPRHWTHHRLVEGHLAQTQRVESERNVSRNMGFIAGTIACGVFIVTGSVLILMGVNARLPSHRGCWATVPFDAVAHVPSAAQCSLLQSLRVLRLLGRRGWRWLARWPAGVVEAKRGGKGQRQSPPPGRCG